MARLAHESTPHPPRILRPQAGAVMFLLVSLLVALLSLLLSLLLLLALLLLL